MNSYKLNMRRGTEQDYRASDNIWNTSGLTADSMRPRRTVTAVDGSTKLAITPNDFQKTLSLSRQLFARVTEVSGALLQKNNYVIGDSWEPRFDGADQDWGREAEDYLERWFKVCNLRGEPFDWTTSLYVDSLAIDRDGDAAMILAVVDGEPRLQFVAAHQIGSRSIAITNRDGTSTVNSGKFVGAKIYNGAIFGKNQNVIGYNILGETSTDDQQIGVESCQLLYEPEWSDQGRGIPRLASSIMNWMDYEDIHHFLKKQVKLDSSQGILHYNETGEAATESDFILGRDSASVNQDVKVEQLQGSEIMYFKASGGGKIEPFRSDRPSPNVDAFTMRLVRGCLQSMGWFFEIYDPSKVGGSSTRLIQDMARSSIRSKQRLVQRRAMRAVAHALGVAMSNGSLRQNDSADWLRWSFTLPSRITVDAHYDDETSMNRIKLGAGTYAEFFGEKGKWWEDEVRQRIKEQAFFIAECARQGVDVDQVQLLTPNGMPKDVGDVAPVVDPALSTNGL